MSSNNTFACMICRVALKGYAGQCPGGHAMICMGTRWRAPKRSNTKAWKKLANGVRLWDTRAVQSKLLEQAAHQARSEKIRRIRKRKCLTGLSRQAKIDYIRAEVNR